MTKKEMYSSKTQFSKWLRDQTELDSEKGYICTDLDYIWLNYKKDKWMMIEEKRTSGTITNAQRIVFKRIHKLCLKDPDYQGMHQISFENTNPDDGRTYLNGKFISKRDLINFLTFSKNWKQISKQYLKDTPEFQQETR
jgi:hypothetical protein